MLITRRPHKFVCGDIKWSYACSCDRRIAEFLKSGVAFTVEMYYTGMCLFKTTMYKMNASLFN